MPPKQKEAKKGPTYKNATPIKDLIPPTVKQPPRQSRPIKVPESYAQIKNPDHQALLSEFPQLFEEWPNQQAVKSADFGINSETKYQDECHSQIMKFIEGEMGGEIQWKNLHEIYAMQQQYLQQNPDCVSSSDQEDKEQVVVAEKTEEQPEENSTQKIQQPPEQQKSKKELVIIETFMRQETEEEMEKRKQIQAEKAAQSKDKKKGKKEEQKEEGPIQVSDVKMSNIQVSKLMCESGIWIGSQLQIIKQRKLQDVYTEQAVWKKIYPQENGVPQITQSGKYWVKLYYMGKPIKIEIDDRMPISSQKSELFPGSKKKNEKWTQILAKALVKLFLKVSPERSMLGSGMIVYALTGMITQNISLEGFGDWNKILKFMGDENYRKKNIVVNVFNKKQDKESPSNFIDRSDDLQNLLQFENSTFKKKIGKKYNNIPPIANLEEPQNGEKIEEVQEVNAKYFQNNVIKGFSYCIGDYFQNNQFNMVFSKDRSTQEKQLRQQYTELSKVVLGNKTRQQKLEHRKKKKDIKERLQLEEKRRLQQINHPIKSYHFLKLLGNISILCQYKHKQILLAKKCALNNLERPPNYEIPSLDKEKQKEVREQSKSGLSTSVAKLSKQQIHANIEVNPSLQDFSSLEKQREVKQILERSELGVWIQDKDLLKTFDQIQIFYNPNSECFEKNVGIENIEFKGVRQFSLQENTEVLMIEKKGNPHLQNEQAQQGEKQEVEAEENIKLLFGFSYQQSQWDTLGKPYCMLQKFDFDGYRTTSTVSKLDTIMNSTFLELKNQNNIFKIYPMSKGRYAYWISCSAPYKLMSIAKYLEEIENYSSKQINIDYPPLEGLTYYPLSRIKIKQSCKQGNTLILKFDNSPTYKFIEKILNFKLVQIPSEKAFTSEQNQGIIDKGCETVQLANGYTRVELAPLPEGVQQKMYYLIVEAYPDTSIADGTLSLKIMCKNSEDQVNAGEQIEPYKIVEKYVPNKYGILMKQRIYTSKQNNVSLLFKVCEGEQGQPIAGGGKGNKKGGKQEQVFEIIEKPLSTRRLIHFKILKNNKIFYYGKGYNEIVVSNIYLPAKQNQQENQYYIETCFDLREWPDAIVSSDDTNQLYWNCQIYGDQSIAFVKDTKQEQKEKQTRKSWEDKQPGRAEKAKKSRMRFLLQCKRDKGEELTEDQLAIVNAPKMTKKQLLEQQKKNEDKKGGKGAKKDDKKAGKDKKQEVVEEVKQERSFPKSQDNFMGELKEFLKNLQNCQVENTKLQENQQPRIRSKQQQEAIKEGALMSAQNRVGQLLRNIESRQTMKLKEKDKKDRLTILLEDSRASFEEQWKKYLQWRIQDCEQDKVRQEKQKSMLDVITTAIDKEKTVTLSEGDLTKLMTEYREIQGHNELIIDTVQMIQKNIRIANMIEKINNLLAGWEVDELKGIKEEIEKDKIQGIQQQLMKQVNEMLEQAEKNPGIVQEKQAELKKAKKGGKK